MTALTLLASLAMALIVFRKRPTYQGLISVRSQATLRVRLQSLDWKNQPHEHCLSQRNIGTSVVFVV